MQAFFNRIWYQRSALALFLLPFHYLLWPLVKLRHWAYTHGHFKSYKVDVPVVVVGNISVGGTGKTPFMVWLYNELKAQGIQAGIVSRGYKAAQSDSVMLVTPDASAEDVGDEPLMLVQKTGAPLVIGANRVAAAQHLLTQIPNVQVILSDDGLQHYPLARDIEIALVDGTVGLGNGRLLPAGPLRESPSRLASVDYVVANTQAFADMPVMQLHANDVLPVHSKPGSTEALSLDSLKGKTVHAVAGIGNPKRFFDLLRAHGLIVIEHPLPDHYMPFEKDFDFGDDKMILLTEKDAVKCRNIRVNGLWYLPVMAQLPEAFRSDLIDHINRLIRS